MQLHKSTISLLMWSNSRLTFTFNAGLFSLNLWRFSLTQWRRKKSVMILWSPSGRNRHDCVWYFINLGLWLCVTLHVHIYMQFPGSFLLKSPFYMSCWCFGPQGSPPLLPSLILLQLALLWKRVTSPWQLRSAVSVCSCFRRSPSCSWTRRARSTASPRWGTRPLCLHSAPWSAPCRCFHPHPQPPTAAVTLFWCQ